MDPTGAGRTRRGGCVRLAEFGQQVRVAKRWVDEANPAYGPSHAGHRLDDDCRCIEALASA